MQPAGACGPWPAATTVAALTTYCTSSQLKGPLQPGNTIDGAGGLTSAGALRASVCDEWELQPGSYSSGDWLYVELWALGTNGAINTGDETIPDLLVMGFPTARVQQFGYLVSARSRGSYVVIPALVNSTTPTTRSGWWDWAASTYRRPYHRLFMPIGSSSDYRTVVVANLNSDGTALPGYQIRATLITPSNGAAGAFAGSFCPRPAGPSNSTADQCSGAANGNCNEVRAWLRAVCCLITHNKITRNSCFAADTATGRLAMDRCKCDSWFI